MKTLLQKMFSFEYKTKKAYISVSLYGIRAGEETRTLDPQLGRLMKSIY